ncbi:hypothetical protein Q4511_08340 [Paracoccus sp. 1_MG-2023]|uniref:hypothetical protein n=1 Tax=unclassified Paracoccus (in: a-proteobacteria) TaxID=2688777 RepID=UPI001C08B9DA|nr:MULTISPECIES: hypothetical protein [unclassified Paracoccus (in: a-proteobacteria)]MBU2957876.1 hypothetical protein [Paracoccus sp. C2R09]MDO6668931.1 hypothetical protein [Paracoccus sp. 1_MG-2023]
MSSSAITAFAISGLLFASFVANLLMGAGGTVLLGNVGEMLLMAAAATAFAVGTLISEARQKT